MADDAPTVTFKKREKKSSIRKKRTLESEGKGEEQDKEPQTNAEAHENATAKEELSLREKLELKRLQQKLRNRSKGLVTSTDTSLAVSAGPEAPSASQGGLQQQDPDGPDTTYDLDATFTNETVQTHDNEHMTKYVEENLRDEFKQKDDETKKVPESEMVKMVKDLYTTPEHLDVKVKKFDEQEDTGTAANWVNGIAEVELPIEYKLKNIEETEKAKRSLLLGEGADQGPRHKKGRHDSMKATDDIVANRFKKYFRERR